MELNEVEGDLQKLLDVLSSNASAFGLENGHISVVNTSVLLVQNLAAININIDAGQLKYSKFIIPEVYTNETYQQRIEPTSIGQDFIVLTLAGSAVLFFDQKLFDFNSKDLFEKVENTVAYYKLYNFLKSSGFADHHNSADEEIIIYSSGRGILKIKYDSIAPDFIAPIFEKINTLLRSMEDVQLKKYIQNSLFEFATGNVINIQEIILVSYKILSAAKRDFELAVKQFDFEKFRNALYVQKDKFFAATRDVISKIYAQIIGIPISITASVFASYNTGHNVLVSVIILVAFLIYIAIYLVIQGTYLTDINDINVDFERDFEIIKTQSGLPADIVAIEHTKVANKIKGARNITIVLMFSIVALGVCVVFFIMGQIL